MCDTGNREKETENIYNFECMSCYHSAFASECVSQCVAYIIIENVQPLILLRWLTSARSTQPNQTKPNKTNHPHKHKHTQAHTHTCYTTRFYKKKIVSKIETLPMLII